MKDTNLKAIAALMGQELLMHDKERLFGLTKGRGFESNYLQLKRKRAKKLEHERDLSVYEGRVPINQRLILLCQDFLESVFDFNIGDLFNLQNRAKHGSATEEDTGRGKGS